MCDDLARAEEAADGKKWHKHCVTTWREPRRRQMENNPTDCFPFLVVVLYLFFSCFCRVVHFCVFILGLVGLILYISGTTSYGFGTTRKALLNEAGFEKVFRTQNWVRRSKLFCRCISVAA